MKKFIFYSLIFLSLASAPQVFAQSTMTDNQVLEYVKSGMASGKSQKVMMQELVAKGVDRAQAERVKKLYESQMGGTANSKEVETVAAKTREHVPNGENADEIDPLLTEGIEKASADEAALPEASDDVYGRSVFRNNNLTFAPSANLPTPKNYVLGPGDEVIVDIFGANQSTIRSIISPEGYINVNLLGPIYLSGKTIQEANVFLKNKLAKIYEGLVEGGEDITDIQVSLGQIRSIQVSIIGEVPSPGTYMISSLSTVFHAMFRAGGVREPGTVRAIKVVRNNKTVATIDIYDFLINGTRKNDVRLEEGDVILVEPYEKVVKISGYVRRPMNFEMKDKETLADLLKYAGGFSKAAFTGNVSVVRQKNHDYTVSVVDAAQFDKFVLENGDEIEVKKMEARFENRISISGMVYLPGVYELNNEVNSVRKLIAKAGGLMPEAFTQRALIHRQREDRSLETFAIDLEGVVKGTKPDVALRNNDEIVVHGILDLQDVGTLTISGEVAAPATFPFASNTTVKDLILMAGGLLRSASSVRIDVARKINDNESLVAQRDIATYYTFTMQNGYSVDGAENFVLEPYDVVVVRRSPSFVENKVVTVSGEVNFPGNYNLSKREERITDLISKSGNLTDFAYPKGATLKRKFTTAELEKLQDLLQSAATESDALLQTAATESDALLQTAATERTYQVSFDLEDAIKNPGGENDIVLREGDELIIPIYNNTVRVCGAVQAETTLSYHKGLSKRNVINAAGGYAKRAMKRKVFIVYMNGRVSKLTRFTKIEPGSQIFVPKKEKKEGQVQQNMAIATSVASLGMMAVSIANLLK